MFKLFNHRFFFSRLLLLLIATAIYCNAQAQLCNGSLGDPIVNITFGAGNNPGPALSAATTNYRYIADACPVNGYYTLLNKGVDCNYGWHILPGDHTGNANGYFMLVDAAFDPGDFYLDTVKNLCANTTYEFAAWMLNMKYVLQGIRPNITFNIETLSGQVLQTYNSGDIPVEPTVKWKQYGFYFTTPSNVSAIVLRMINNAAGGNGNDLALDDITFRPCGQLITSTVAGNASDTIDICEDNNRIYNFKATVSSGYQSPDYQWQLSNNKGATWNDIAGATNINYQRQPTLTGNFWYRFAVVEANSAGSAACRIVSNAIIINVHAKPTVNAGTDRTVIPGYTLTLNGMADGENITFSWAPDIYIDNKNSLTPKVTTLKDIAYILSASSVYGCSNKDTVQVKVVKGLFIPSAFSPDGDGLNDTWKIPLLDPGYNATVNVINRYGQLVYHSVGQVVSWDGKLNGMLQPAGSYVYLVTFKKKMPNIRGTVTLIR